jgi:predicted amidohydrolase
VELIVFPETFVPYYPYFSFVQPPVRQGADHLLLMQRAPTVPGPLTDAVAAAARAAGMVVVLGVNERDHGSLYNTQLIFDADGRLRRSAARSPPPTTSAWSGARATAAAWPRWTPAWAGWARWPAGSTTTRWPAMR